MQALAARLIDARDGAAAAESFHEAGEADPQQAAEAFRAAAAHEDLGPHVAHWAPLLLATARPGFAARHLAEIAAARREHGMDPLAPEGLGHLTRVLGSSPFLARLMLRHPGWTEDLEAALPPPPDAAAIAADWTALRRAKYRGLLRIAARDLAGRDFPESLAELSSLADRVLDAAQRCAVEETGAPRPALFALGKLGGRELNFSSDVDLLFLFEAPPGIDLSPRKEATDRLIRRFKGRLEEPTEDGFGYRVDLDLRPEGRTGLLCNSLESALTYYENLGAEWERQMLIRLRAVAGPPALAAAFPAAIEPFVWRKLIDPSVMRSVRDMKLRIEQERRGAGRDLEADLKEGPGGIRDVEFLVQSLLLFHGGRDPTLRTGNVLEALERLAARNLLVEGTAEALRDAYLWLRRAEHALQMEEEQQTARFPRGAAEQLALARRMGYADPSGTQARAKLLEDWTAVRAEVRGHFDALVLSDAS